MGIYDREYIRTGPRSQSGLGAMRMLSVNTWIIIVNVAVYLLDRSVFQGRLADWFYFSTAKAFFGLEIWRFVGFQFLHANFDHILFNMLGLFFFGQMVEEYLGRKRYLAFYLLSGVSGALMYLTLNLLGQFLPSVPGVLFNSFTTPLIGASAGVFGVLMAAAFIAPNATILLFFILPMRLSTAVYGYVAIVVFNLLSHGANAGGDAAHLGGALAGFYFIRNPHLLRDFFDGFVPTGRKKRAQRPKQRKSRLQKKPKSKRSPFAPGPSDAEIDRILAKVATQGLHSLSESERKSLRKATQARKRV